jgi:hypothetical protein
VEPSENFKQYIADLVRVEITRFDPLPIDLLESRIWAVAVYDRYCLHQGRGSASNGLGPVEVESEKYCALISSAISECTKAQRKRHMIV